MNQSRVTIRYAKALLQLATEQNMIDNAYNDMILINKTCTQNKDFQLLLKSPIVKTDQKLKILNELFISKLTETSMAFINIITTKKRENLLALISKNFISLYKTYNKIETAIVTTSTPIDESLREEVVNFIKKHGHQKVELTEHIDKKIIGGTIIKMGDKQLDTSVSREISELKQRFNKNLYVQDF